MESLCAKWDNVAAGRELGGGTVAMSTIDRAIIIVGGYGYRPRRRESMEYVLQRKKNKEEKKKKKEEEKKEKKKRGDHQGGF